MFCLANIVQVNPVQSTTFIRYFCAQHFTSRYTPHTARSSSGHLDISIRISIFTPSFILPSILSLILLSLSPAPARPPPHGYPTPVKYALNASSQTYTVCSSSPGTGTPHVRRARGREIDRSGRSAGWGREERRVWRTSACCGGGWIPD